MNTKVNLLMLLLLLFAGSCNNSNQTELNLGRENKIETILQKLSLEEKIFLIAGSKEHMGTNGIPDKGIPALNFSDGPMGMHSRGLESPAYPALISLAATFNSDLGYEMGSCLGKDYKERGIHVALAPGVNIYRMPLCGRNFEYLGEDPYVAAKMAAQYIKGMQSEGTAATVKHYTANFQEYDRHGVSSDMDERTLREIYLPAFEASVKEANVAAVMTAYNLINGEHASENRMLLNDVLKEEWGFDGIVMSDWTSTYSTVNASNQGLDLEMPTGKFLNKEKLLEAIKNGTVTEEVIDDKVRRLLRMMDKFGWLDNPELTVNKPFDDDRSEEAALNVAREGIVLLKNDGILPVDKSKVSKIAVIGYQAGHEVYSGGGSAKGTPDTVITLLNAIKTLAGEDVEVSYNTGVNPWRFNQLFKTSQFKTKTGTPGLDVELFNNNACAGIPDVKRVDKQLNNFWMNGAAPDESITEELFSVRWTGKVIPKESGEHVFYTKCSDGGYRFFINDELVVDTWDSEVAKPIFTYKMLSAGQAVRVKVEYRKARHWAGMYLGWESTTAFNVDNSSAITAAKDADIVVFSAGFTSDTEGEGYDRDFEMHPSQTQLMKKISEVNANTVVCLYAGGGLEMKSWREHVKGIMHLWYPGMNGALAAAEILFGETNPSGKLPICMEEKLEDNAAYDCYFDPQTKRHVQICEGVFGGHRHYDRNGHKPLYPFGYGLSYTTFEYSNIQLSTNQLKGNNSISVTCDIKNTGQLPGAETAFLFIHDKESAQPRPVKELKGFSKVFLEPGESKKVQFEIDKNSIRYFDAFSQTWQYETGEYELIVSASSDLSVGNVIKKSFEFQ